MRIINQDGTEWLECEKDYIKVYISRSTAVQSGKEYFLVEITDNRVAEDEYQDKFFAGLYTSHEKASDEILKLFKSNAEYFKFGKNNRNINPLDIVFMRTAFI